jgi:phenylalanyl-tRNA synthetase beta chain
VKAPVSWLRNFAPVPPDAHQVATKLAACGFEVASIEHDVIDFEITANRPDCLSVYGLAREASAAFDLTLADYSGSDPAAPDGLAPVRVSIGDHGCGRYALAVFDVKVQPSPAWLTDRLTAAGVRPINNIVDVTNYVMLELGHPMHAFDAAKLAGPEIRVRRARAGEPLTTLDGQARTLDETMLVIADRERAVAIAGVMGGAATEVSSTTTKIALESAWFQPATVRATSRRLSLKTEASIRFERGADWAAPVVALRRARALLTQLGAGQIAGGITDVHPRPHDARRVTLRRERVSHLLGTVVPDRDIARILGRLGFGLTAAPDGWTVDVPTFRVDVTREADLVEEIGRHWGFDRIPPTFPALRTVPRRATAGVDRDRRLRRVLCGAGLQEAVTFTFIEEPAAAPFLPAGAGPVPIANPLSEKFAVLRPALVPGLLDALVYSRRREHEDVRFFEVGTAFTSRGEERRVGWVLTGARGDHWSMPRVPVDFFDAAGIAELVGDALGVPLRVEAADDLPWFVRGRAARIVAGAATEGSRAEAVGSAGGEGGGIVGSVGELRADLASARGLAHGAVVVAGEIAIDAVAALAATGPATIAPIPRHPSIVRDLAIVVSERLPAADVRATIRRHAPATLAAVREFDRYQGSHVPAGHVSLAIRLTFRDAGRTLTDAEVQQAVDAIVAALAREHGATLRGGEQRPGDRTQ